MNDEWWTMNDERWTSMNDERWMMNAESWMPNHESYWIMNHESWIVIVIMFRACLGPDKKWWRSFGQTLCLGLGRQCRSKLSWMIDQPIQTPKAPNPLAAASQLQWGQWWAHHLPRSCPWTARSPCPNSISKCPGPSNRGNKWDSV